jgi:hypothetical protein
MSRSSIGLRFYHLPFFSSFTADEKNEIRYAWASTSGATTIQEVSQKACTRFLTLAEAAA